MAVIYGIFTVLTALCCRFLLSECGGSPGSHSKRRQSAAPTLQQGEGGTPHSTRRGSWRQAIFNRVVTPARATDKPPTVLGTTVLKLCLDHI